jgi:hypothetical protein
MRVLAVICFLGSAVACVTTPSSTRAPPPSGAEQTMGYNDAVSLGTAYCNLHGYTDAELQAAEQYAPNLWCVRFGLAPKDSGRVLELHFDGKQRTVVKTQEQHGVGGQSTHTPGD